MPDNYTNDFLTRNLVLTLSVRLLEAFPLIVLRFQPIALIFAALLCGSRPAIAHGDLHEQIEQISVKITANPNDPALLAKRAGLYREHHEFSNAIKDVRRARKLADSPDHAYLEGVILLEWNKPAEALSVLDRLLLGEPKHPVGLLTRARTRFALEDFAGASTDFGAAVHLLDPPDPDIFLEQADCLKKLGKIDKAIESLESAEARIGKIPAFEQTIVQLQMARGDYETALRRLDELQKSDKRLELSVMRGEILFLAGKKGDARAQFELALRELRTSTKLRNPELEKKISQRLAELVPAQ